MIGVETTRRRIWRAVAFLGLVLPATGLLAAAEEALAPADRLALARGVEARRLAVTFLPALWSDFDPGGVPLMLFRYGELALLIGHPEPVAEYGPLGGGTLGGQPVRVLRGEDQRLATGSGVRIGGRTTALFALPGTEEGVGHPPAEREIGRMLQEIFRVYARGHGAPASVGFAGKYPEAPELLARVNLENRLLMRALRGGDRKNDVCRFVAVRQARWAQLGIVLRAAEAQQEFLEGLAAYTEVEVFARAAVSAVPADSPIRSDPTFGFYRYHELLSQAGLAALVPLLDDPQEFLRRADWTGAVQAQLLDRLDAGWRAHVFDAPGNLLPLLARACGFQEAQAEGRIREAEEALGYPAILALAGEDTRRLVARRQEELDRFLAQPGFLVKVLVPEGGITGYRYDPEALADPGGARLLHEHLLDVDLPSARFRARGVPVMTTYGITPFDVRELSFVAGEDAAWVVNGSIFFPRPGSMSAKAGIRIEGPGYTLEGRDAHLYMSGRVVEVSFMPAPESGSAPETP